MFQSTLLWQNDDQWAADPLGFGPQTIKEWGCLMTSLTMVVNGFGYQETPRSFNEKMKAADGYVGALIRPAMVPSVFPRVRLQGRDNCENAPAPVATIDAALAAGQPVVLQVDWSPLPGLQSHWVLAYARDGDDYLILDPYRYAGDGPGKPLKLLSRYHHSGAGLEHAITGAIYMAGTPVGTPGSSVPGSQPKPRVAVPPQPLTVTTTGADLALRAGPAVSEALIKRLPQGASLTVLEPGATAQAKVGQYNLWLNVQDAAGDQGYVAAWYVTAPGAAPASGPAATETASASSTTPPQGTPTAAPSPAASGALILVPTGTGLALRAQPALSGKLIKRLPITAQLKVLDQAGEAARKLGVEGQWIYVRDVAGAEGFVAAWYVTSLDNPALGVKSPAEGGAPVSAPDHVVRTTGAQVALRRTPAIAPDNLIKRLPLRAELLVLEPSDEAKLGKQDQWLKVRDLQGVEGYVAAWYVAR